MEENSIEKKTVVTDGQDLAEQVEDLKKNGVTDVTVVVNTFNYTKYKKSNEGKELEPVIKGINKAHDTFEKPKPAEAPTTKICPFCKSEIPVDATRCPHCTSELPKES